MTNDNGFCFEKRISQSSEKSVSNTLSIPQNISELHHNSGRLKPSNKNNPCPVCDDTSGKCREHTGSHNEMWSCMTFTDSHKFEIVNNYKCIGHSADGLWGLFIPEELDTYQNNSEQTSSELKAEREERELAKQQAQQKKLERIRKVSLSAKERDNHNKDILSQLSIDEATRADLKGRGFTDEQIEQSDFKSIHKGLRLNKEYTQALPGIVEDSFKVNVNGYLCPIRDFDGNITAFQVRLHKTNQGNRYLWISHNPDLLKLQPENENPLAVFHPKGECKGIAIVEGTGAKPYFLSLQGYLTIGAAGGQWNSSPQLLKKYIQQAVEEYGDIPITIFPDAGFLTNKLVLNNNVKLLELLKESFPNNCTQVADWNQLNKKAKDIDELQDLSVIRYLNAGDWKDKYSNVIASADRFTLWANERVWLDSDVDKQEKYLNLKKADLNDCDILLVRKGLGGGKTQGSLKLIKELGIFTVLVGNRNSLINQTIARAEEMGMQAVHVRDSLEKVDGKQINHLADTNLNLAGGCIDSYEKLEDAIMIHDEYAVMIDEIVSVLKHIKEGGTLKGKQQYAIQAFEELVNNAKFVIGMDANLNQETVDFLQSVFPDKKIKVLDSIHDLPKRQVHFLETECVNANYKKHSKSLESQLHQIALEHKKVLWLSDSRHSCATKNEFDDKAGRKHLRVDSTTVSEEGSKNFLTNPGEHILQNKPDTVSISPTGESGLDIQCPGYFDAVFMHITGTVDINTLCQISARLRDTNVPIYVACPQFSNLSKNPVPFQWEYIDNGLIAKLDLYQQQLLDVEEEIINCDYIVDLFKHGLEHFKNDKWFKQRLADGKRVKFEHSNLQLCLKVAFQQQGYEIYDYVLPVDASVEAETKVNKEEVKRRQASMIFNAEDVEPEVLKELENRDDLKYEDQCKVKKGKLKERLPGIESTNSWSEDFIYNVSLKDRNILSNWWHLSLLKDNELLQEAFKLSYKNKLYSGLSAHDVWFDERVKIQALKDLGIERIIDKESFCIKEDEEIKSILDRYYKEDKWVQLINITKPKISDNPTQVNRHYKTLLNSFLNFFGLTTELVSKNNDKRYYKVVVKNPDPKPDGGRYFPDVWNCFQTRAKNLIEEANQVSLVKEANEISGFNDAQIIHDKNRVIAECGLSSDLFELSVINLAKEIILNKKVDKVVPEMLMKAEELIKAFYLHEEVQDLLQYWDRVRKDGKTIFIDLMNNWNYIGERYFLNSF